MCMAVRPKGSTEAIHRIYMYIEVTLEGCHLLKRDPKQLCRPRNCQKISTSHSIDLMHWRHVSITTTPCWGSRLVALRARVVLAGVLALSGSQSVRGPRPARRYGMQGLARWLHAWRWRMWQCLVWPPTCGGALLWRHMHMVCYHENRLTWHLRVGFRCDCGIKIGRLANLYFMHWSKHYE